MIGVTGPSVTYSRNNGGMNDGNPPLLPTDLAQTLGRRETCVLEFKRSARDRTKIGMAICALANDLGGHGGGDLLIGVDDDGRAVGGVDTSDQELLALTAFRDDGRILDRPSIIVEAAPFDGVEIVRIHVEASRTPPVRFNGIAYVRPGPTTRRADREDERVLSERRRSRDLPFDTHTLPGAALDDLDEELFRSTYLRASVDVSVLEENERTVQAQMASLRLCDVDGSPTVLGVLLVGLDPPAFLPGAYVQFARFQGDDPNSPVLDDQELRTNVIDVAERLDAVLRGHLHTRLVETGGFREAAQPDYPFEALREACMNAIMHRNYESSHAPIRILWFDDRIEISNPGGPFGQVRADNFDRVNDYRNPSLAAAMKSLGYVNRFGRGIGRIQAALRRNGNPEASFGIDDVSWSVTLRKAP